MLYGGGSVAVESLFIAAPIIFWGFVFGLSFVIQCLISVLSSFLIISPKKRELVALHMLLLSCGC